MRLKNIFTVAIANLAGAAFAFAQSVPSPPPPAAPSSQSTVHVTTRIVQVSVTVRDDRGRPITGLTKDDFVLLDQGKRQQIASFSEQTNSLTANSVPVDLNVFTNRIEPSAAPLPLTVIVLDDYNARYWDLFPVTLGGQCPPLCAVAHMFNEVEKFISGMRPQDRVAIYELVDNLYLLQDFTNDPSALRRAVDRGKEYSDNFNFSRPQMTPAIMSAHTMDGMHAIADRLAKLPGRKNLIWLSTGFPPDAGLGKAGLNSNEKMDSTAKSLSNADFPLFAMSGLGLTAQSAGGGGGGHASAESKFDSDIPTPAYFDGEYGSVGTSGRPPRLRDFDFIKDLADTSGGSAIENTNDLASAIRKVIDDSSATYLIGYYPDHNKWDGEFREIKVKVNRPGVEVLNRKGYFAVEDNVSSSERETQKLADAIHGPLQSNDLGFDVLADGVEVDGARQLKVKVYLDANQLRFQQKGGGWADSLSEVWAEFDAEAKQVGEISKSIDLSGSEDEHKNLLQDGFSYSKTLALAKGAIEVRLILRDDGNGAIGSVIISLAQLFPPAQEQASAKK